MTKVLQLTGIQGSGKTTLCNALPSMLWSQFKITSLVIESPVRSFFKQRGLTEVTMAKLSVDQRYELQLENLRLGAQYYRDRLEQEKQRNLGLFIMDRCGGAFTGYTWFYGDKKLPLPEALALTELFPEPSFLLQLPNPTWSTEDSFRSLDMSKEKEVQAYCLRLYDALDIPVHTLAPAPEYVTQTTNYLRTFF